MSGQPRTGARPVVSAPTYGDIGPRQQGGRHEAHRAVLAAHRTRREAAGRQIPVGQVVRRLCAAEAADQNRYRRCRDGMVMLGKGVAEPDHRMIVLDKVRRENLPSVGDPIGARRAIPLGEDEGLLEPAYCLFAARNIIAMLTSGDGPRPRRVVDYLKAKLDIEVGIKPVLKQNLDDVLAEMRISEIQVAIPVSRIDAT